MENFWGPNSSWFWGMMQTFVVGITLYLIYRQVKFQRYGNMITALNSFRERWYSISMTKARLAVLRQFEKADTAVTEECLFILGFFEELGAYHRKKIFDTELVWGKYSFWIENFWLILEPMVLATRKKHRDDQSFYEDFQYLKDALAEYSRKQKVPVKSKTDDELKQFILEEINLLEHELKKFDFVEVRLHEFNK